MTFEVEFQLDYTRISLVLWRACAPLLHFLVGLISPTLPHLQLELYLLVFLLLSAKSADITEHRHIPTLSPHRFMNRWEERHINCCIWMIHFISPLSVTLLLTPARCQDRFPGLVSDALGCLNSHSQTVGGDLWFDVRWENPRCGPRFTRDEGLIGDLWRQKLWKQRCFWWCFHIERWAWHEPLWT